MAGAKPPRKRRSRSKKRDERVIVVTGLNVPDEIFPWERELLAPYLPDLVHAVLKELTADEQGEDRSPPSGSVRSRFNR